MISLREPVFATVAIGATVAKPRASIQSGRRRPSLNRRALHCQYAFDGNGDAKATQAIFPRPMEFHRNFVCDGCDAKFHAVLKLHDEYRTIGARDQTDSLADLARLFGHDGLVVKNVRDSGTGGPLGTTYAALRPGTVKSALTGGQIYGLLGLLGLPAANPESDQGTH